MKLSRTAAVIAVGAVLFAGGCSSDHSSNATAAPSEDLASQTTTPAEPPEFIIHNGASVSGPDDLTLKIGENVKFTIISDKDDQLDIAGYEKKVALKSGEFATVEFKATTRGTFPMKIRSGTVITTLVVS